jgi:hypothetical protein
MLAGIATDMVEHNRIAAMVENRGGNWQNGSAAWRSDANLKLICSDLDETEIDIPAAWLTGKTPSLKGIKLSNWSDAFMLGYKKLLADHIRYRLKMVHKTTRGESAKP